MPSTWLNSLFRERKVFSATYANLPTTGIYTGDLGYATDRLQLYRWSGSAWVAISRYVGSGTAAAIPSAADLANGSIYYETDTQKTKQVQSSSWVTVVDPTSYGATKEIFVPATKSDIVNAPVGFVGYNVTNGLAVGIVIYVPHDFTSVTALGIVVIPKDTNATANIDLYTYYGAAGEAYGTHTDSDTASTYNITTNQIFELDFSALVGSLAAGDYLALRADAKDATSEFYAIGARLRYS